MVHALYDRVVFQVFGIGMLPILKLVSAFLSAVPLIVRRSGNCAFGFCVDPRPLTAGNNRRFGRSMILGVINS